MSALETMPTVFTHAAAQANGISDRSLRHLRDTGALDYLARGVYARPGLTANVDHVEIAVRAPLATLCLTTALAHHDLSDDIASTIDVALPRHQRSPTTRAPVTWHRFAAPTFDIGRSTIELTDDVAIGIYSPTRCIVDAYRLRHLYGVDQAHSALKRWLRTPGSQPSELLTMAAHFPKAQPVIRTTLEVLL